MCATTRKSISCILAVAVAFTLASCFGASIDQFDGLEQRVNRYYQLEQRSDWESAYDFHTPAYRRTVSKESFLSGMRRDDSGWKLVSFKIISVKERDKRVHLRMAFVMVPPPEFFGNAIPSGAKIGEFEMEDESVWERIGGEWYSLTPGTRQHLPLNAPLVQ